MIKILSIFILVFISYFPAINGGFIWDDDTFLTDNPIMAKPDALKRFWVTTEAPDYFPLVSTTLWLQRLIWGLNPMGYHIFNIVLHAFNGVMLWLILYKLRFRSAWLAAAIFAVHPVHVESVAWITEIKNLQSTFFFMLSLICYLNFTNSQRKQWYLFSVIFFFMALLSKTSVVMLPILLLLYHWWSDGSLKKEILLNTIPFFTFSVFFSAVTIWFQYNRAGAVGEPWSTGFLERILVAGRAVWFYMGKLVFPFDLMFIYPHWSMEPQKLSSYMPTVALILLIVFFWNKRKIWGGPILAGSGYFMINLFPVLGFFNIYFMRYSFVADHWQYLASPGIIVMVVWIATSLLDSSFSSPSHRNTVEEYHAQSKKYLKASLGILLLGFLTFTTFHRAEIFKKNFSLWEDTLAKNPGAWMAHNNMGIELEKQGKLNEAIKQYKETLRLNPSYAVAYNNLGLALKQKGDFEEATIYFRKAIQNNPKFWESLNNLGYVLNTLGRREEAASYFQQALAINPFSVELHNNLANILVAKGKIDKAKKHYKKALRIDPENAKIHINLGTLFQEEKEYLKAINHFQKALQLKPDLKEARQYLSVVMEQYRKSNSP